MISPDFNFREFLRQLADADRSEIIQTASRERRDATDFSVGRGSKYAYKRQRQTEYITDLGDFLYFVRTNETVEGSYTEAYLNSSEYKNTLRHRNLEF